MKKIILILVLLALCVTAVSATPAHMVDDAGLLTSTEEAALEATLSEISNRYNVDVVIVTVDSTNGDSPMDFADDYYDYGGYRPDGILLLVSMEDSDWWVSTTGYGITAVTDAGLDYMSDRFVPYLSDAEYAQSFTEFANLCDSFLAQAKTGDPYDSHNLPKDPYSFFTNLVISVIVGLVAALIVTGKFKAQLKTVSLKAKADDYVKAGSLQLTRRQDLFLYSHLDRREKPQSSSGSSTHVSSSGTTHGGGGGKF